MRNQETAQNSVLPRVARWVGMHSLRGKMNRLAVVFCLALVTQAPASRAQDMTFKKTRYSSVKQPKETDVALTIADAKLMIKGKKENGITVDIPYTSIDSMTYELAARHRVGEGAGVMLLSPATGAVLMLTKTKSHWLDIEYHDGEAKQEMILRLDKSEYKKVLSTLEARTGKPIARLHTKTSPLNPTAGSKDVDEVIPFRMDAVAAALKPAMETFGCKVTEAKEMRVECKRGRGNDERTGYGGEKITAELQAKGEQTRLRLWTGKGFVGRVRKNNWSTPIYQEMLKTLQKPAQSAAAAGTH